MKKIINLKINCKNKNLKYKLKNYKNVLKK